MISFLFDRSSLTWLGVTLLVAAGLVFALGFFLGMATDVPPPPGPERASLEEILDRLRRPAPAADRSGSTSQPTPAAAGASGAGSGATPSGASSPAPGARSGDARHAVRQRPSREWETRRPRARQPAGGEAAVGRQMPGTPVPFAPPSRSEPPRDERPERQRPAVGSPPAETPTANAPEVTAPEVPAPPQPEVTEPVEAPPGEEGAPAGKAAPRRHRYTLQVAAYSEQAYARRTVEELTSWGYEPYLETAERPSGDPLYRVRVGFASRGEARRAAADLTSRRGREVWLQRQP